MTAETHLEDTPGLPGLKIFFTSAKFSHFDGEAKAQSSDCNFFDTHPTPQPTMISVQW